MEFEEMNQRAYRREDPPDGLTPAERDFEQYRKQEAEWLRCQTAMKLLRRCDLPIVQGIVAEADKMFSEEGKAWH